MLHLRSHVHPHVAHTITHALCVFCRTPIFVTKLLPEATVAQIKEGLIMDSELSWPSLPASVHSLPSSPFTSSLSFHHLLQITCCQQPPFAVYEHPARCPLGKAVKPPYYASGVEKIKDTPLGKESEYQRTRCYFNLTNGLALQTITPAPTPQFEEICIQMNLKAQVLCPPPPHDAACLLGVIATPGHTQQNSLRTRYVPHSPLLFHMEGV